MNISIDLTGGNLKRFGFISYRGRSYGWPALALSVQSAGMVLKSKKLSPLIFARAEAMKVIIKHRTDLRHQDDFVYKFRHFAPLIHSYYSKGDNSKQFAREPLN